MKGGSLTYLKKLLSTNARSNRKSFDAIPGPKPLPFIGNIWRYLPLIGDYKPDTLFENAQFNKKNYGPIVREKLTNKLTILHLFDPVDIETFVRQDGKYPHRRSHRSLLKYRQDRRELYLDGGLFPENGSNWHRQRNQFQRRLLSKTQVLSQTSKLDSVSLFMMQSIDTLSNGKSNVTIEDFESILYRWALANSLSLFLDIDIVNLGDSTVNKLLEAMHNTLQAIDKTEIQSDKWVKHGSKCPYYKMLIDSQDFLHCFVSSHIDKVSNQCKISDSYLQNWLHVDKLDRKDIVSFAIDSLLAGLHTTTYTIAFLLHNIARHPRILESLHQELKTHLSQEKKLTISCIDKLVFLKNCLRETLRMNPVSIGTGRLTSQTLTIRNYEIPKDVMIITQNQVISRDEEIYNEPDQFKPERWTYYRTCPRDQKPSPFATLPFGFGARSCIGQRIAELQIKVMAARLLQRFNIQFNSEIITKTTLIHNLNGHITVTLTKN